MTFIRQFFQGLISLLEKVSVEDACALLGAAGLHNFELANLMRTEEETEEVAAVEDVSLPDALCLEAECPVWSWKSPALSASFLWKKEAHLNVRDWIYLA